MHVLATLFDSLLKILISSVNTLTDGMCMKMALARTCYSTPHRKPEICFKWEGGVEGCFSGELVRVGVWGGTLTGGGQECDLAQAKKLLYCAGRKVG